MWNRSEAINERIGKEDMVFYSRLLHQKKLNFNQKIDKWQFVPMSREFIVKYQDLHNFLVSLAYLALFNCLELSGTSFRQLSDFF